MAHVLVSCINLCTHSANCIIASDCLMIIIMMVDWFGFIQLVWWPHCAIEHILQSTIYNRKPVKPKFTHSLMRFDAINRFYYCRCVFVYMLSRTGFSLDTNCICQLIAFQCCIVQVNYFILILFLVLYFFCNHSINILTLNTSVCAILYIIIFLWIKHYIVLQFNFSGAILNSSACCNFCQYI